MKLCFFAPPLTYDRGVNKLSVYLIKYLAQNNDVDEIYVVCDGITEDVYRSLRYKKVNLQCTGLIKRSDSLRVLIRNIRYLHTSHKLKNFDIFHVLDDRSLPFIKSNAYPLVVTIHNASVHELSLVLNAIAVEGIDTLPKIIDHYLAETFSEFLSVKKASKIIVNHHVARILRKLYGNIVIGKIRMISPGFDPRKFNSSSMSKSDAKQLLELNPSSKVLLHVCGHENRKGLPYLLNALHYMCKTGQMEQMNILLLVLGKVGRRLRRVFHIVRDQIIEMPYVPEDRMPIIYRAADVLVMPSISEGWGIALIEALACGTPVIASQHVPAAFDVKHLSGVHIEREMNDPVRFSKSIHKVLDADTLKAKDWNRTFNSLVLHYSWENYARSHINVYKEIINEDFHNLKSHI